MTAPKKYTKRFKTGTLFSVSSFLSGVRSINLAGNNYKINYAETGAEADRKALENDFNMIGHDIKDVFRKIKG